MSENLGSWIEKQAQDAARDGAEHVRDGSRKAAFMWFGSIALVVLAVVLVGRLL